MPLDLLGDFLLNHYEVYEWKHATSILRYDFPQEFQDVVDVLTAFHLEQRHITERGGNKSLVAAALDKAFYARGWTEKKFETQVVVDGSALDSPTHKVDCFRNCVGLEIEWNNKDPFFDRDLNNFRLLFDLRVLSVGIIVTRSDELRNLFAELDRERGFDQKLAAWRNGGRKGSRPTGLADKYGESTTHMGKLIPRIDGGGGAGCPLLVFGIKRALYVGGTISPATEVDMSQDEDANGNGNSDAELMADIFWEEGASG